MNPTVTMAIISCVFYLIGTLPYLRDTVKWRTLPHPFSYFVWLILTGFNTIVLGMQWESIAIIPAILPTISCFVFTIYGIRVWKQIQINSFDYGFLILALLLLPFYFYTQDILLTVIFSIIIDFLWYLPSLKKWWLQPWSETLFTFLMIGFAQLLIVFTQDHVTLESWLFWWYVFWVNIIFVSIIAGRRYFLKWWYSIFE